MKASTFIIGAGILTVAAVAISAASAKTAAKQAGSTPPALTATGPLSITSTPTGAEIILDGKDTGQTTQITPVIISGLSTGAHVVQFTLTGYQSQTVTPIVRASKTVAVTATLPAILVANITAVQPSTFTIPSTSEIDLIFMWQNQGNATGTFTPAVSINGGAAINLTTSPVTLAPGETYTAAKALMGLTLTPGALYTPCPVPN